jgi:hypothetical protein
MFQQIRQATRASLRDPAEYPCLFVHDEASHSITEIARGVDLSFEVLT